MTKRCWIEFATFCSRCAACGTIIDIGECQFLIQNNSRNDIIYWHFNCLSKEIISPFSHNIQQCLETNIFQEIGTISFLIDDNKNLISDALKLLIKSDQSPNISRQSITSWQCPSCTFFNKVNCDICTMCHRNRHYPSGCLLCGGVDNEENQVLCDSCDYAYHIGCLIPPLSSVPDNEWFCPDCVQLSNNNTSRDFDSEISVENNPENVSESNNKFDFCDILSEILTKNDRKRQHLKDKSKTIQRGRPKKSIESKHFSSPSVVAVTNTTQLKQLSEKNARFRYLFNINRQLYIPNHSQQTDKLGLNIYNHTNCNFSTDPFYLNMGYCKCSTLLSFPKSASSVQCPKCQEEMDVILIGNQTN